MITFPPAASVFCPFTVAPQIAAVSMSGLLAAVALNALMFQRGKLAGIKTPKSPDLPVAVATVAARAPA